MAYLGRQPIVGNYQVLDALTATTTDTYALTKNSVAVFPQTPANCIVSLNGVIQAPFDSYNISGSNIVFDSALTGSDSIDFITVLGDVLNVGTVSDGTIGLAKLSATGTKDATTFLRGDNTFAVPAGGTNTPAFEAYTLGYETVTSGVYTKLSFPTETFDTDNCYDNATNYRFTPTTAGKYFVYAKVKTDPSAYNGERDTQLAIYKNGGSQSKTVSDIMTGGNSSAEGATASTHNITGIIDMNGTTDYIEVYGKLTTWSGSGATIGLKLFGAYKIIE